MEPPVRNIDMTSAVRNSPSVASEPPAPRQPLFSNLMKIYLENNNKQLYGDNGAGSGGGGGGGGGGASGSGQHTSSTSSSCGGTSGFAPKSRELAFAPSLETLLDILVVVKEECEHARASAVGMKTFAALVHSTVEALEAHRINLSDFELKRQIAETTTSTVWLGTSRWRPLLPLAVKCIDKANTLTRAKSVCYREELEFLTLAASLRETKEHRTGLDYIVSLRFAFQDHERLYLLTDYCPGGDLLGLLEKFEIFPEDMARHYIAQVLLAVEAVHALGYAHRDITAENILLTARGHVVLADFGSCIKLDGNGLVPPARMAIPGGTPDYISPELLSAIQGDQQVRYGASCDWWSLGVLLCEMLCGDTPFGDDSLLKIYRNIMQHQPSSIKADARMSESARDLISKLCCPQDKRLGRGGAEEIKSHPFFHGTDWERLKEARAPFVPELSSSMDTSMFETKEIADAAAARQSISKPSVGTLDTMDLHLPFVGYYFMPAMLEEGSGELRSSRIRRRTNEGKHFPKRQPTSPVGKDAPALDRRHGSVSRPSLKSLVPRLDRPQLKVSFENTAVFLDAAKEGDVAKLRELLDSRQISEVDLRSAKGQTALSFACENNQLETATFLLDRGANVNAPADDGCTPLHLAVLEGHETVALYLLSRGADGKQANAEGETPLDWATENGLSEVIAAVNKA